MIQSRKKNVILNVLFGYVSQIGILIISLFARNIFLRYLTVEYLGINGLFSNILNVLSLPELGIDSAVVYFLYKPVADGDAEGISAYYKFFKRVYIILAIAIFSVGLALIPVLRYVVTSSLPFNELIIYYILFLANTVMSYFIAHKVAIICAYQHQRIQKVVALCINFLLQIAHIIVLAIWRNYYIYLVVTILGTVLNNAVLSVICKKMYPIGDTYKEELVEKKQIFTKVKSTFVYKIGAVIINSTDNILISSIVGIGAVGLYSNYYIVISSVQSFLTVIITSLISSIGNLAAKKEKEKLHNYFIVMLFVFHFISALGFIGFYFLFNDFITIWIGKEFTFSMSVVFVISLNFYLTNAVNPVWMFREANGLFEKVKYLMISTAVLNIILSVLLGKVFGVFGILLATSLSRLVTGIWYEPGILFKSVFNMSVWKYWKTQTKYFVQAVASFCLSWILLNLQTRYIDLFVLKMATVVFATSLIFYLGNVKSNEINMIKFLIRRR